MNHELQVSRWLNTESAPSLAALRGQVVVVHAFQMLCPACVSHGLPQAKRLHEALRGQPAQVLGLHTVFEHHEAVGEVALRAFVHEYRLTFPIGIDRPGAAGDPIPQTMRAWGLRGTPSLLVFDAQGRLRAHEFGAVDDLPLGLLLGQLLGEMSST
jgi:hypothetical protein